MPTADERFNQVTAKLERAKKHLCELEGKHKAFVDSKPFLLGQKRGSSHGWTIFVEKIKAFDDDIPVIIGDVLQNLVSALDHLAYQLVCIGKNSSGPFLYVYFPFGDTKDDYDKKKKEKLKGAKSEAIQAVDQWKPFKGGNDLLWRLSKLNNIDKHRHLLIVGGAVHAFNIGAVGNHLLQSTRQARRLPKPQRGTSHAVPGKDEVSKTPGPFPDCWFQTMNKQFPLKEGDVIAYESPGGEEYSFYLGFGEPEFDDGRPMIDILNELTNSVEEIIVSFKPFLS